MDKRKILALVVATQGVPVFVYRDFGTARQYHLLRAEAVVCFLHRWTFGEYGADRLY
jgi:hypothetical protein